MQIGDSQGTLTDVRNLFQLYHETSSTKLPRGLVRTTQCVFGKKGYIVTSGGGSNWKLEDREGAENAMAKVSMKQKAT